ncbi:hypothetical protein L202_06815 [Cryptococcus amylolentus CBS 6039]|uniref:Uncharacterized protein n=2 Tax=Cryptococcus amylolentus TaxID=104669 RepID=A0A1E3HDK5_9TREE|nr:hypothetical protein L202_06815 [Cryptococcus amylolentus CBS 6039]ODN74412.1 hypothetical protein L202_06815 [Cryptococcus amylolentus CBS 6039]ODO01422.1 hypothetical protein I350_06241 [Cryptococcus amylolentus CBS 6273]
MLRTTPIRLAQASAAPSKAAIRPRSIPRPPQSQFTALRATRRSYATEVPPSGPASGATGGGGGGNGPMLLVLAAIVGVGAGGYYYLKPVRDAASVANTVADQVKTNSPDLSELAGYAKSALPPGVFALYSHLSKQPGGINGFLSNLKDKDLKEVLEELKKVGGDDVKRVVDKVQKKIEDAKGNVENVDWKALVADLKGELPAGSQKIVDLLIGKLPDKADIDNLVKKAKEVGEDQLKQLESSANKVWLKVEEARKDGKGQADALLKGLKEAAPADVDALIKQLKEAAKKAGLPADQTEAWLKSKVDEGKINTDELAGQVESKLKTASKFIPGEPKDLVKQVEQVSPSLAKLVAQALQQSGVTDENGNKKQ